MYLTGSIHAFKTVLLLMGLILLSAVDSSGADWETDKEEVLKTIKKSSPVGLQGSKLRDLNLRSDVYAGFVDRSGATANKDSGRLGNLLTVSEPPSTLDSPYVTITKGTDRFYGKASYESLLAEKIVGSRGNLRLADILKMSLDVCDNDYLLATLTAHNLLKETAYSSRNAGFSNIVGQSAASERIITATPRDIIGKLQNLRPAGDKFESDVIGPYYHAFGLLFLGGALSSSEAAFAADMESALRHVKWNSPQDSAKESINTWASRLSEDINKTIAASPVSVTVSGENNTVLGKEITLYGKVSLKEPIDHKYVWRDENHKVIAVNMREFMFSPEKPGLSKITLDICEAGDGPVTFGADSSYRFACPRVIGSASHAVYVDALAKVSVKIEGPAEAGVGDTVELKAVVTNLDKSVPLPALYYYWSIDDEKVFPSKDNKNMLERSLRDAKPLVVKSYIGQLYMNNLQKIADTTHRVSVNDLSSASLVIEGPSRVQINENPTLKAVVKFRKMPADTPEVRYVWTDKGSGVRLGNSSSLTLKTGHAGTYYLIVEAHVLDKSKNRYVKLAEAKHTLVVEEEHRTREKQTDYRQETPAPKPLKTEPLKQQTGQTEDEIVAEYRSLLPASLAADKKPWHTRTEIVSNAVKVKSGEYRVNYRTYCIIDQGPNMGKDSQCFEYDGVLNPGQLKSAVIEMRKKLKR